MAISSLPLSYCTNVHPGRTLDEVTQGLVTYTARVRRETGQPLAAGLWLAAPVIRELRGRSDGLAQLRRVLEQGDLFCYTINAFPYGDFHSERVKEQVYVPDWTSPARLAYTADCAAVLAELLPDGTEGSISTVPLGFKSLAQATNFESRSIDQLLSLVRRLDDLHDDTGRVVRLAIEPEPLCVLETTAEAIGFFTRLYERAAAVDLLGATRRHIGLCYDVCHQSVEFEDVAKSIQALHAADIRINKVHITCALRLEHPSENQDGRAALARYVEPRYLHQTFARRHDGGTVHQLDLDAALCTAPPDELRAADEWRVHFHVPVNAESLGPLGTTRADLKRALAAVAGLPYAPHLEVETYTWGVLPGGGKVDLATGLAAELSATRSLLDAL
jgi:sugar phosphate isomerase/epimerase